ncbi:MAG: prepilin-type N-terminal cleavage/methylation domain-containing protein [Candidatus Tectomicrobia bacterium]|nr:prepilin-type N-terminal cleavage/methylation domain-containing protein [Candidatus Tectomicrobia bacterium]
MRPKGRRHLDGMWRGISRISWSDEGFTLLEVILSIVVLGGIITGVYTVYFQAGRIFDTFVSTRARLLDTSSLAERLQADLAGLIGVSPTRTPSDSGLSGGDDVPVLRMVSVLQRGTEPADQYEITYRLRKTKDGEKRLVRAARRVDQPEDARAEEVRFLEGVESVKVVSFDGFKWTKGFAQQQKGFSQRQGMPRLLRVSLETKDKAKAPPMSYSYVFEIPASGQTGSKAGSGAPEAPARDSQGEDAPPMSPGEGGAKGPGEAP